MLRSINLNQLNEELDAMQRLNEALGVPLLDDYFRRIREDGWATRNPDIYHLYEVEGELRGYAGLLPITAESCRSFVAGERFPVFGLRPNDILTPAEYARARREGVWFYIESFVAADVQVQQTLGEYVYQFLSQVHLKGLLTHSSASEGEAECGWLGLTLIREAEPCPTGVRKLWYADEALTAPTPDQPFGPPTPARCLFLTVDERFGQPVRGLHLTPAERRVARLFYVEDRKADQIARLLGMKPNTVKTHLQRIRGKAEPILGSRLSRRIAAYLLQHPGETAEPPE